MSIPSEKIIHPEIINNPDHSGTTLTNPELTNPEIINNPDIIDTDSISPAKEVNDQGQQN